MAKELGMTVRQLLCSMDSREFTEWQCFFTVMQEKIEEEMKQKKDRAMYSDISTGLLKAQAYRKARK